MSGRDRPQVSSDGQAPGLKLIATDLDGTFLGDDGLPSHLNLTAVRRAAGCGVRIVFATGRPARWLQVLDLVAGLHPDAIASNGAVLYDVAGHRLRQAFPLPRAATLAVMADVKAVLPKATFAVEYVDGWGRLTAYPPRGDFVEANVLAATPEELLDARVPVKLLILGPGVASDRLAGLVEPLVGGRLDVTFSMLQGDGLLELSAPGVTKASALRLLLRAYDIAPAEVAAFGDMPNDLPMLELAGRPFAMSNAHPAVLQHGFPLAGDHDDSAFGRTVMGLLDQLEA